MLEEKRLQICNELFDTVREINKIKEEGAAAAAAMESKRNRLQKEHNTLLDAIELLQKRGRRGI